MKAIRFVPTGIHAYFDYIGGIALLAAPFIFGSLKNRSIWKLQDESMIPCTST